jgi:hypothetical protein
VVNCSSKVDIRDSVSDNLDTDPSSPLVFSTFIGTVKFVGGELELV